MSASSRDSRKLGVIRAVWELARGLLAVAVNAVWALADKPNVHMPGWSSADKLGILG
jgi:hypothetical protein